MQLGGCSSLGYFNLLSFHCDSTTFFFCCYFQSKMFLLLSCQLLLPGYRRITCYKGNYDVFVKTAAERLRNAQKAAEAQQAKRDHVQVSRSTSQNTQTWSSSFCYTYA